MNKSDLRKHYKSVRNKIYAEHAAEYDSKILNYFLNSKFFHDFDIFLCYVSVDSEVNTIKLIEYLIEHNKKVAVPYCNGRNMDFYEIHGLNELVDGSFGIPTADIGNSVSIVDFDNALCILPALSFDKSGGRLGYGGGFYDRFLESANIKTLGLSYEACISDNLPLENYDVKVDSVLTENGFRYF